MKISVLHLEDNEEYLELFENILKRHLNFEEIEYVYQGVTGESDFWRAYGDAKPDLIILDIDIAGDDAAGHGVCRELRSSGDRTPIVMLTGHGDSHRIRSLEGLATQFAEKGSTLNIIPVLKNVIELNVIPRTEWRPAFDGSQLEFNNSGSVRWKGQAVELRGEGYPLVKCLSSKPSQTFSKEAILNSVGKSHLEWETVTKWVNRARNDLRESDPDFDCIKNVRASGYSWVE
jgi:two-component system OmpR family response regulator